MPVERTRGSKRNSVAGSQLTWTVPVEPTTPQSIAFAPNLTPITFNDPPPAVDPSSESVLFPPPSDCPTSRRSGHSKKKPENHIPRPPNAFILFRSSFIKSQHVSTDVETNHSTLSKIIGLTWQNLPPEERSVWHGKAKAALDEHRRKFPQYAFRPLHSKKGGTAEKRKVREVGPKDMKRCEKIAALLVEGKKGQELEAAIQEFDRTHVPEVVTRFETPITARMYRRSSSVPALEPAERKPFLSATSSSRPQRVRASSSQPTRQPSPCLSENPSEMYMSQASPDSEAGAFYGASFPPSFTPPVFSFPPKCEPSFDFDPFTFDENIASSPMSSCDPHMQDDTFGIFAQHDSSQRSRFNPSPLSINTTFMEDWTPSSSPLSSTPATPQSCPEMQSPVDYQPLDADVDPFAVQHDMNTFGFDSYNLGAHPENFQLPMLDAYPSKHPAFDGSFMGATDFSSLSNDACFASKPELAQLDMELSAFMSSLTPPFTPPFAM